MRIFTTVFTLFFFFLSLNCEKIPEQSGGQSTSVSQMLANFHVVEPGLWRSAQPDLPDLNLLKSYGLKTLVNVQQDSLNHFRLQEMADSLALNYYYFPLIASIRPEYHQMQEILATLKSPEMRPVLVHCHGGDHLTGLVIGLYKMQFSDASFKDIRQEMLLYGYDENAFPFISITVEKWRDYLAEQRDTGAAKFDTLSKSQ